MKRSEINALIRDAESFFSKMNFKLPPWAAFRPEQWKGRARDCAEIIKASLGWDITDFGSGNFAKRGLLLFTIRNGSPACKAKTYAEKIMIVRENQETPMHFHWKKMEDIINRGGGNLVIELFNSTRTGSLAKSTIKVSIDGVQKKLNAGTSVILTPGESICLGPGLYHRFYGENGKGTVLVGEVSKVNDDSRDNRFLESIGRFPAIEEDEAPYRLLSSEYKKHI
jgi:D-lyxose ketol-isomerase